MAIEIIGRSLTSGEVAMLQTVFGDSINYSDVRITNSSFDRGVSLNGNIGIPSSQYQTDFSQDINVTDKVLFVHEMTHVWQSQNGYPVLEVGLDLQKINETGLVNPYQYDLDSNKSFMDFNMEAQANLISQYYALKFLNSNTLGEGLTDKQIEYLVQGNRLEELERIAQEFMNSDRSKGWLPSIDSYNDILKEYWGKLFGNISDDVNSLWHAFKNWVAPRRDPLVLDLDGDGIETLGVNATTHVVFDYDGDGVKTGTGWIKGDDGFVVLDRNGNGTIDNGGELFGDQTLVNGAKAADGFAALSAQDTNANGKFDAGDTNFTNVRIWQDTNSDGISQAGELHTLNELGVTSINLTSTTSNNQNFNNTRSVA